MTDIALAPDQQTAARISSSAVYRGKNSVEWTISVPAQEAIQQFGQTL
jgi:hypothetical protein